MDFISSSAGSTQLRSAPLEFELSGGYNYSNGGSFTNEGSVGLYWSSSAYSASYAYYLNFNSSNVDPQITLSRGYGLAVRWGGAREINFLRTGSYYRTEGGIYNRVHFGLWWSKSSISATNSYYLNTRTILISYGDSGYRGAGFAVRCVVREG